MRDIIELGLPPHGRVADKIDGPVSYIEWEPGNGFKLKMMVSSLPKDISDVLLGSEVLIHFFQFDGTFKTVPFNVGGLFHLNYATEKGILVDATGDITLLFVALVNWAVGRNDTTNGYAEELWQDAVKKGWIRKGTK